MAVKIRPNPFGMSWNWSGSGEIGDSGQLYDLQGRLKGRRGADPNQYMPPGQGWSGPLRDGSVQQAGQVDPYSGAYLNQVNEQGGTLSPEGFQKFKSTFAPQPAGAAANPNAGKVYMPDRGYMDKGAAAQYGADLRDKVNFEDRKARVIGWKPSIRYTGADGTQVNLQGADTQLSKAGAAMSPEALQQIANAKVSGQQGMNAARASVDQQDIARAQPSPYQPQPSPENAGFHAALARIYGPRNQGPNLPQPQQLDPNAYPISQQQAQGIVSDLGQYRATSAPGATPEQLRTIGGQNAPDMIRSVQDTLAAAQGNPALQKQVMQDYFPGGPQSPEQIAFERLRRMQAGEHGATVAVAPGIGTSVPVAPQTALDQRTAQETAYSAPVAGDFVRRILPGVTPQESGGMTVMSRADREAKAMMDSIRARLAGSELVNQFKENKATSDLQRQFPPDAITGIMKSVVDSTTGTSLGTGADEYQKKLLSAGGFDPWLQGMIASGATDQQIQDAVYNAWKANFTQKPGASPFGNLNETLGIQNDRRLHSFWPGGGDVNAFADQLMRATLDRARALRAQKLQPQAANS